MSVSSGTLTDYYQLLPKLNRRIELFCVYARIPGRKSDLEVKRMPVLDRKMKVLLRRKEQQGKRHSLRLEKN